MKAISSESNPAFRRWLRVAQAPRAVRSLGITLAEGLHLAQAAVQSCVPIEAVLVRRGALRAELEAILGAIAAEVPRYELANSLYERLAPVEQGAGVMLVLPIAPSALPWDFDGDLVYLDGVQDPGNVGAILRTAAAAGIGHVLASAGTAALWAPKVLRAAMGAHFRIGLHEHVGTQSLAGALRGSWLAAVAHDAPSLWEHPFATGALGWVFGAEGAGPSSEALAACAARVCIPTSAAVESLNVGAAAAICLFERLRCERLRRR